MDYNFRRYPRTLNEAFGCDATGACSIEKYESISPMVWLKKILRKLGVRV